MNVRRSLGALGAGVALAATAVHDRRGRRSTRGRPLAGATCIPARRRRRAGRIPSATSAVARHPRGARRRNRRLPVRAARARSTFEHEPRAGAGLAGLIVRVQHVAEPQRETAAPDAPVESVAQPFEHRDLLVEPGSPRGREALPVLLGGRAPVGQRVECGADLGERQAHLLGHPYERDPPQRVAGVAPLTTRRAGRGDQALGLVVPQRRCGDTGAFAECADGELRVHEPLRRREPGLRVGACCGPRSAGRRRTRSDRTGRPKACRAPRRCALHREDGTPGSSHAVSHRRSYRRVTRIVAGAAPRLTRASAGSGS